ncbi:MAG: PPOX class F420-dependent oxidoreductase [Proteobacteria bacterium]|nr:MAG: PPOX class F420-dependent oxidoreductase [Pseudomonadota bacterium]
MSDVIPDKYKDLLTTKAALAHLGTIMRDGRPQVTPIWFSYDGEHILLNSAKGRVKDRNMRARPKVALSIVDPDNAFRYVQIMGTITEITEDGADAHVDTLAQKYLGKPRYPWRQPGEVRVIYKITPDRAQASG